MSESLLAMPIEELKDILDSWRDRAPKHSLIISQLFHLEKCGWDKAYAALSWEDR